MIPYAETKVVYTGDGKTTVFPFTFKYAEVTDVKVSLYEIATDITTVLTKDYYVDTVAGTVSYPGYAPGQEAAESEQPAPLDSAHRIVIYRETEISQPVDLGEKYPLSTLERMHDRAIMLIQELEEVIDRAVTVEAGSGEDPSNVYRDIRAKAELATNSAAAAATSEKNAKTSETIAFDAMTKAAKSQKAAAASETNAKASETATAASERNAKTSETAAATSEGNAKTSEEKAAKSESEAAVSAVSAANSAAKAGEKYYEIKGYTADAATSKNEAESYAALVMGQAASSWSADKVYNTDDVVVYNDGYIYRCMSYSAPGTIPTESTSWVKIKVALDDFFTLNDDGYLVQSETPTFSSWLMLDGDAYITLKEA